MAPRFTTLIRVTATMLGGLCLVLIPGCNIVTPVAYVLYGPGNVKAKFTLDTEAATVVFVDDPSNRTTDRRMRNLMAQTATATLIAHAEMLDMIDPASVLAIATRDSFENPMSITEIGKAVEADVLIYVAINRFELRGPGGSFLPTATVTVKIMDINGSVRVWPEGPQGVPVNVGGEYKPGAMPDSTAAMLKAEESLAARAGVGIAQLFYTHEITENISR